MLRIKTRALTCYIAGSLVGFVVVGVITYFMPKALPFGFFEFWTIKGSLWEAVLNSWWLFLFGIGLNMYTLFSKRDDYKQSPGEILMIGFGISLWAGVAEEICFRWIIFLSGILLLPLVDSAAYWATGWHMVQDFYTVLCPVANFFTLGYLEPYLMNGYGWAVAAALMSSNGQFRNGHARQGLVGITASWFGGMYFFYIMFNYGLLASMLVHFLYDFFIFAVVCVDAKVERIYPLRVKVGA